MYILDSYRWDYADGRNPSSWKIRTRLYYVVHFMVANDLVTQGASPSADMVLTKLARNIPFFALAGYCHTPTHKMVLMVMMVMMGLEILWTD